MSKALRIAIEELPQIRPEILIYHSHIVSDTNPPCFKEYNALMSCITRSGKCKTEVKALFKCFRAHGITFSD